MIIYKLTSPSNKSYIGMTKQSIDLRFRQHVSSWKKLKRRNESYTKYCPKLFYAFDKYDPVNWTKEILFESDILEEIKDKEIELIKEYNTIEHGYNILEGGQQGNFGHKLTEEHKKRISESRKKFFQSKEGEEWKKELSNQLSNNNPIKPGNIPWNKGKSFKFSEKAKQGREEFWSTPKGLELRKIKSERMKKFNPNSKAL